MKRIILALALLISVTIVSSAQSLESKHDSSFYLNQLERDSQPAGAVAVPDLDWNIVAKDANSVKNKKSEYSNFENYISQMNMPSKGESPTPAYLDLVYPNSAISDDREIANWKVQSESPSNYLHIDSENAVSENQQSYFSIANMDQSSIKETLTNLNNKISYNYVTFDEINAADNANFNNINYYHTQYNNKNSDLGGYGEIQISNANLELYKQFNELIESDKEANDKSLSKEDYKYEKILTSSAGKLNADAAMSSDLSKPKYSVNNIFSSLEQKTINEIGFSSLLKSPILEPANIRYIETNAMLKDKIADEKRSSTKNYALVIGTNQYRHDAELISNVLKTLGYEVIELTDATQFKPTKYNILNGALEEINQKNNKGNVIIYYSGHGEKDEQGNYYLVPEDANNDPSLFISAEEIKERIKNIKNLALIIDGCNSGGFETSISDHQVLIASSKKNEPSSQEWMGSYSVFTHNLATAIKEAENGRKIQLDAVFYEAQNETVKWASSYLLSQTPNMVKKIDVPFYLN